MTSNNLISFDIFDTALIRKVFYPTDIFKIIEEKVGNNFYNKRIEAEKKAREKYIYYNIVDIYRELPEFDIYDELDAEMNNCFANPDILKIYNPDNCVFISDMYLPSYVLVKMLEKIGYKDPKVYVSCEMKAIKATGELFKKVEEVTSKKIKKHYGDNYIADILGAKIAQIEPLFNPAIHDKDLNLPIIKDSKLKKWLALIEDKKTPLEKLALSHVPLAVEFTKWILENRKEGQKIFFLSRDMYTLYIIAKDYLHAEDVYYLHVSRRSLASISLKSMNKELKERINWIYTEEERKKDFKKSDIDKIEYLKSFNIQDNDIIVDIGYAGTIQATIDYALGIKTLGMYMQVAPDKVPSLNTKMFFNRPVIHFPLMVEIVLGSDEDCVESYKNKKPIFKKEDKERKKLAKILNKIILEEAKTFINEQHASVFDIEQILIHQQYYPSKEIIDLYNKPIYSNRVLNESIINFNVEEIRKGNIKECYARSYCKPLFKKMLNEDKDLKQLNRFIND